MKIIYCNIFFAKKGKISRIIVKGKKEITEEELLENERIICYSRDDSDNEQQKEAPKMYFNNFLILKYC